MRLFIAEKPSIARAIAEVLPGNVSKKNGYFEFDTGDVVAFCAGHILELAEPHAYDPEFERWRLEHLPILPQPFKLQVSAPDLYKTIKALLGKATRVVHAGDADPEGQLLVDEVLQFTGFRGPVDRMPVPDPNPDAVRKALASIRPNSDFKGDSEAALARQRADWLYGINMTRLYTLLGQAGGYDGTLSVGRVQTVVLGLIVRRDLEIENFKPVPYFVITAQIRTPSGALAAKWRPGPDAPGLDAEKRLIDQAVAAAIQQRTHGQRGRVVSVDKQPKSESAPLPYKLADLQKDAVKKLGLSPAKTLEIAQALYETHRLTTYPRTDCNYIPEDQHAAAPQIAAGIAKNLPALASAVQAADLKLKGRAWNDKKVTAHYGIIPTVAAVPSDRLSEADRGVYELVARRYLAQFYPPHTYEQTSIVLDVAGETFTASGRTLLGAGWKALYGARADEDDEDAGDDERAALPPLKAGEPLIADQVGIEAKQTNPPKRFNEASILDAMTGIAAFVSDPKIKQLLKESDGIGTPATQASIIETLFTRNYVRAEKKQKTVEVISSPIGRALIQILPPIATLPDMTAFWEAGMKRIQAGDMPLEQFQQGVIRQLQGLVQQGKALGKLSLPGVQVWPCPACQRPLRRKQGEKSAYWYCPNKEAECKTFMDDDNGRPTPRVTTTYACTAEGCAGQLRRVRGKDGFFWSCTEYKNGCKNGMDDRDGKPVPRQSGGAARGRSGGRSKAGRGGRGGRSLGR